MIHTNIRIAEPSDLDKVMLIEEQFGEEAFAKSVFKRQLGMPTFCVLEAEGIVVGYYLLLTRTNWGKLRLYSIAVDPAMQKRGFGALMMQDVISKAFSRGYASITLEVAENNPALRMYENFGFKKFDLLQNYYTNGDSAFKMELIL